MDTTVPLNKLLLSPRNVRKTYAEEGIEEMADSILARGLLQNLVVSESPTGRGFFEVDAGGRRWRALQLNVKRRRMARDWPVPVKVVPREEAAEASLEENIQKIALNPADEFEAFATIIAGYEAGGIADPAERIAHCARRFGKTIHYVEQRLRLAALAPEILEALRADRISLDAAKAYAAYPDQKLQMRVFAAEEKKSEGWRHTPQNIRDVMRGRVYQLDHPAVVYVGIEAYVAAGGRVQREMFMGAEDRDVVVDPALIDKLAQQRTAEDAEHFAQEEGWKGGVVKPWAGPSWQDAKAPAGFVRSYRPIESMSEDQRAVSLLAFRIADDGSTLTPLTYCFLPEAASGSQGSGARSPETDEERELRRRQFEVQWRAAHLASPHVAGTPFEGRAFWPPRHQAYVPAISQTDDGHYVVALLIKVPAAEVEAQLLEAEKLYDRELEELAEEEAAVAAEQAGDVAAPTPAEATL